MRLEGQKWRQERVLRRFWRPRAPFWRPKGRSLIYDVDFWEGSVSCAWPFGYAKSTASTAEHLTISHALASLADAADFSALRACHRPLDRELFANFSQNFCPQRQTKFKKMIDYGAAIHSVKKSPKSELSSRFLSRFKF